MWKYKKKLFHFFALPKLRFSLLYFDWDPFAKRKIIWGWNVKQKKNLNYPIYNKGWKKSKHTQSHITHTHQGSISSTFYYQLLRVKILKEKTQSSCQSFLCFWDLCMEKLFVERWWNWPHLSITQTQVWEVYIKSSLLCIIYGRTVVGGVPWLW